eukprot:6202031-Pleurochrysis_carterae.AAC.1
MLFLEEKAVKNCLVSRIPPGCCPIWYNDRTTGRRNLPRRFWTNTSDIRSAADCACVRVSTASEQAAEAELALLSSLPPHPCIVSFHGFCRRKLPTGAELSLMLDYCAGGTLADALNGSGPIAASSLRQSNVVLTIFAQSCAALAHLHAQQPPVAHCDFKPENLLLYYSHASSGLGSVGGASAGEMRECGGVRWKLCDFGSVRTEPFQFVESVTSVAELAVEEDRIHKSSTPQARPKSVRACIDILRA